LRPNSVLCRWGVLGLICAPMLVTRIEAQNRGVYPLGMNAVNSGLMPAPGFTYTNQLLTYARDEAKADDGSTLSVSGRDGPEHHRMGQHGDRSGRLPIFWLCNLPDREERSHIGSERQPQRRRRICGLILPATDSRLERGTSCGPRSLGFLAPTGRFAQGANNNVGSGYWTFTGSSGQTFYLTKSKSLNLSAYEMYEFHTMQEGTGTHPGDTFDLDYSLMRAFALGRGSPRVQIGLAGYEARQTTAKTGPEIAPNQSSTRYAINAIGFAATLAFPDRKLSFAMKYFDEFADRSTFQGFSLQFSGSMGF